MCVCVCVCVCVYCLGHNFLFYQMSRLYRDTQIVHLYVIYSSDDIVEKLNLTMVNFIITQKSIDYLTKISKRMLFILKKRDFIHFFKNFFTFNIQNLVSIKKKTQGNKILIFYTW